MTEVRKIFVLGASGYLGRNLLRHWPAGAELVPVLRGDLWQKELAALRARGEKAAIVNCVAMADLNACERDPEMAFAVNAGFAESAAIIARDLGVPFYQISSDGLFPSTPPQSCPRYWIIEQAHPITAYGRSKLEAERNLERLGWGHCLRLSFVGPGYGSTRGLLTFLARKILDGVTTVPGYLDIWFSPVHTEQVTEAIANLVARSEPGFSRRQWGTFPAITKFDFLREVVARAKQSVEIQPISGLERIGSGPVQNDQSLKSEQVWDREDMLSRSARSLEAEIRFWAAQPYHGKKK